jgi:hypothetical protein
MSKRFALAAAVAAALAIPIYTSAHEGHPHKVMGTVAAVRDNQLEVTAIDGKKSTIALNEKTKIVRGKKSKIPPADIKPGERVVVTALQTKAKDGKTSMVATEVKLPEATASK